MLRYSIVIFLILIVKATLYSQTGSITNIQVSQRTDNSGLVDVYFDLSGPIGDYYLNMYVSFDGGTTYTSIGSTFLSGDIGPINPGTNKHIIWDGGQSFPDTYSIQSQLKITALKSDSVGTLVDSRDGQSYTTVQIGSQQWMAENLNYVTSNSWSNGVYGRLYTPNAALSACPSGWHLPSDDEWKTLEMALGMTLEQANATGFRGTDEGIKMKSTSEWVYGGSGTNISGFNGRPGGYRTGGGSIQQRGYDGRWWSSTVYSGYNTWSRNLGCTQDGVFRYQYGYKTQGYSVRCLKD